MRIRILVVFVAFAHYDCLDIKKVDITGDAIYKKTSVSQRKIRGFVGGPSSAVAAHRNAVNVSEHIKQVMHRHFRSYFCDNQ